MTDDRKRSEAKPGRLGGLARLPLFFSLQGKSVVIAGGSAAAAWKAELLSAAGAKVAVYAAEPSSEMLKLATDPPGGHVVVHRQAWIAADLAGAALAIGDFEDEGRAAAFCCAARAAGVPVNIVDRPEFCDFSFGAIVNRSPLVVGISTDGAAPIFAQAIRSTLEALLPTGFAHWTAAAARWRQAVKESGLTYAGRRKFWHLFAARAMRHPDRPPRQDDFDRFIADAAGANSMTECGSVTLLSLDPDDPDLLTLRAIRALHSADAVLFDDQVPREALDFARREACKIAIGDVGCDRFRKWRDIDALSADLVKQGKRVVLLASRRCGERVRERLSSAA